ncbi:MAG TPA: response regulator [bacterium]|jgi:CheY-like chemotaxis protein|nr:response regulator [bacterium]
MKKKVLVIEDNEQNLYLTTFLLEKNGFAVVSAKNGHEGILAANEIRPDMILLDIQLPQIDGYTVARRLRKNRELDNVPVVAVTSYAMVGDRERALESGCSGYIEKPINPDTFISEVKKYFKEAVEKKGEDKK